jgi:Ca-activated chloride channel family protein
MTPLVNAVLLVSALAPAPQAVPVFSSEVTLVNVAVTVEDSKGNPIPGLQAKDFVLSEDGKVQRIDLCARTGDSGGGPSSALDVALLVDTSDSMIETLRRSQESAVRFLMTLPSARELLVVLFDQNQRVEKFDREHPEALFERLKAVPDGGNTALRDAITSTLRTLSSTTGRSALVLLTDGLDTVSAASPQALERAVQSNAVVLYPVAFPAVQHGDGESPESALKSLERLAEVSGGRLFKLSRETSLSGVLDEILADLRAQYVLGFAPTDDGRPDRLRKLTVKVPGRKGLVVRHRVGYRRKR